MAAMIDRAGNISKTAARTKRRKIIPTKETKGNPQVKYCVTKLPLLANTRVFGSFSQSEDRGRDYRSERDHLCATAAG